MNIVGLSIRLTAVVIFIQLALGGLLTFDFISPVPHIVTGFVVLGLAVVTVLILLKQNREYLTLRNMAVATLALILIQIIVGFTTLNTGNQFLAWLHLLIALAIYGMIVSSTFMVSTIGRSNRKVHTQ